MVSTFRALAGGFLALGFCLSPAAGGENNAKILAPADGANLEAKHVYQLQYDAKSVPKADHVHVYVDGDEAGMEHRLKGTFKLGPLAPGARKICVKVVNKNHVPIAGSEDCINVTVH